MVKYSVKRLLRSLFSILIIVSAVFLLLRLMPISGYFKDGAWDKLSWDAKLAVLQRLGIYDSDGNKINAFVQLYNYIKTIITSASLGVSTALYDGKEVLGILAEKMPVSMMLGLPAFFISLIIGCPLGVIMARYKDKVIDSAGMVYIVIVQAVPSLVIYFLVQFYVTDWINSSMIYRSGQLLTYVGPVICLSLLPIASNALWVRRYMVDEFNKDYVKLARAKGLKSSQVMFRHVFRNAFVPMAYTVPTALIGVLTGSLYVEKVFSIPGMGKLLNQAIYEKDNNLVQAIVFAYAIIGVAGVFLGDIFVGIVDPRISFADKEGTR